MSDTFDIIATPQSVAVRRVVSTDTADDVGAKLMALDRFTEWLKDARKQVEESAKEYIEEHGPVRVGTMLYYVDDVKKPTKCVDVPAAVEAVLQAVGGDFGAFCQHLASGALKYGSCKRTLAPDVYERLFRVDTVREIQCDEAAKVERKLQKQDTRFLK